MVFGFLRPLDGWRAFVGEVGIIVLGVLIALGAGQVVDAWQWRQQVRQAKEVFSNELNGALLSAYLRLSAERCLTNRLEEIAGRLKTHGATWSGMPEKFSEPNGSPAAVAPMPLPYHAGRFFLPELVTEGWSNALSNNTVNHLPYIQAVPLSTAYAAVRQLRDDIREEEKEAARLAPLAGDMNLTPDIRMEMVATVHELARLNQSISSDSSAIITALLQAQMGYTAEDIRKDEVLGGTRQLLRTMRGDCVVEPRLPTFP